MKHTITLFLWLLLIATTLEGDNPKGWYSLRFPASGHVIEDICFIDSLRGWAITDLVNDTAYILYTSNGGEDWQVQSDDSYYLYSIDFVNDNTGYIAASEPPGIVLKTSNGGNNWFVVSQLAASPIWDIDFVSPDTGWICSDDLFDGGIFRTTNGGASWQRQVQPLLGYQLLDFLNKDTGWCLLNDGKVFKTTNSGVNWNQLPGRIVAADKNGIQFISDSIGWIVARNDLKGTFRTSNAGMTWTELEDPSPFDGSPYDVEILSENKGWIAKLFGMLTLVSDSVLGVQNIPVSPLPRLRAIDMVDTLKGYAAGGVILKTADGGGQITGINSNGNAEIDTYSLIGNYPNPFNSQTVIRYKLKEPGYVAMEIFDITGRLASVPIRGFMSSGNHEVAFDASALSSGVYVCFLKVSDKTGSQAFAGSIKMILSK